MELRKMSAQERKTTKGGQQRVESDQSPARVFVKDCGLTQKKLELTLLHTLQSAVNTNKSCGRKQWGYVIILLIVFERAQGVWKQAISKTFGHPTRCTGIISINESFNFLRVQWSDLIQLLYFS